eukprot:GSChrysophyteH2.ASY1.ANO1.1605.1 assembled CDS
MSVSLLRRVAQKSTKRVEQSIQQQSRTVVSRAAHVWAAAGVGNEGRAAGGQSFLNTGLAVLAVVAAAATAITADGNSHTHTHAIAHCDTDVNLPVYRVSEVATHTTPSTGVWVTYKGCVYDITKFIVNHPGGQDKISLAAGKDIGPYWRLYPQHTRNQYPQDVLASMKIGVLHADDIAEMAKASDPADPYSADPEGSPVLNYHMKRPTNAEAPANLLGEAWITPPGLWFVRNHHPVPHIDADAHTFTITGRGDKKRDVNLNLRQLKEAYDKHTVVSSIQCGGNRRAGMNKVRRTNVLRSMGVDEEYAANNNIKHVVFIGDEDMQASVPIRKALDRYGDTLLAYEMNGEELPENSGHPLRVIVPGHVGVRNVKWVKEVRLSSEEAVGPWQRGMSYKGFGPSTTSLEGIDVEGIPSLQEQPVQSVITLPTAGTTVHPGDVVSLRGYAYSGGGRGIVRVDVSVDGGKSWKTAELGAGKQQPMDRAWAWTLWEIDVELPEDQPTGQPLHCICKATDASYNVQPDSVEGIWNLRGINNNAWHRVDVPVEAETEEEEEEEE